MSSTPGSVQKSSFQWNVQQISQRSAFDHPRSERTRVAGNLFQAGLMLRFAAGGGDAGVTEAMQALTALFSGQAKGSADKAIAKLEAALVAAEPAIAKLCQELAAKSQ